MRISAPHLPPRQPLLAAVSNALEALGARVVIDPDGDNLVRSLSGRRNLAIPPSAPLHRGEPVAEVCAQGLPNLLHEYLHVVQAACLDDDHGIDYGAIPFDLQRPQGRRVLWEELACCVLSCAYLCSPSGPDATVEQWFVEQVAIQPVFYGFDENPDGFWRRVGELCVAHGHEQRAVEQRAYDRAQKTLAWAGVEPELWAPAVRLSLVDMLQRSGRWTSR